MVTVLLDLSMYDRHSQRFPLTIYPRVL